MNTGRSEEMSTEITKWKICVLLPTRNEAATLEFVVNDIREAFRKQGLREPTILLTDDSHDDTRQIARRLGVYVVIGGGKGLGFAFQQGLKAALNYEPDVILSMDADGQSNADEIMRFLLPIANGEADLVVGSRFKEDDLVDYRYPWINRLGTIILSGILRRITKLPLTDSHGGLRAMRTEVARTLDIIGTHTYVQESIIDAHEKGFRITEVPSVWRKRVSGKSKVVGSISKYVMYTLPVLVIRSGSHVRWLYTGAFLLVFAASLAFGLVVLQERFDLGRMFNRLPAFVLIALLTMVGTQLFTLGFLAEIFSLVKLKIDRLDRQGNEQARVGHDEDGDSSAG